ncbi:MAG: aminotransferase class V-fold PLP-dependent enzyme [bacterium]|nr:aminotransferase class V-fold PLP-dependent enzyme [bacterium]
MLLGDRPLKTHFLLDPEVIFLNHGSFGACPKPVFDTYQAWQRQLERQPVKFLGREVRENLASARQGLAAYLHVDSQDLVFFPNPTTAVNMVVRSLDLHSGDDILSTNHAYGAMDRTWRFICRKTGARYVQQSIPLPLTTTEAFVERFWAGVTERTRVIFLDHLTSPTALIFPVEEICRRARQAGIRTIIDGAHAPGHIPLDLAALGADIYVGACHKWLCAPKGAAFLYVRRDIQHLLEPLVVSWGYEDPAYDTGYPFINQHEWQGTRDISAFLSVPAAIRFQAEHDWDHVRANCRMLAAETRERLNALTGLPPICPDDPTWFRQFFTARLPDVDIQALKTRLYDDYRIEVPLVRWCDQPLIRVSIQGYNTRQDTEALLAALEALLPQMV